MTNNSETEGVSRFWCHEARNIRCVREADYDAAQSTIAQLQARIAELESGRGTQQDGSALMKIAADLANRHPLRQLYLVCERQGRINTDSLHAYLDECGDLLAGIALDIRKAITAPPAPVDLSFSFEHPTSKEKRTVTLTKRDVFDGMEDYFYDKLGEQICQCESVGETNVVDCSCDEYVHDFEIVNACLDATAALNTSK